jgi:hypothetical protein
MEAAALNLLQDRNLGQLGFHGLDGYPRVLPVWFAYRDGEVLIASPKGAYKGRSLAADGRASLAVVAAAGPPYHQVTLVGDATVEVLPEAERVRFVTAQAERYLGPDEGRRYFQGWSKDGHPGDGELIRIRPRRIRFSVV